MCYIYFRHLTIVSLPSVLQSVYLYVCLYVSLSVCGHISKTTRPNCAKFFVHIACSRVSVLFHYVLVILWIIGRIIIRLRQQMFLPTVDALVALHIVYRIELLCGGRVHSPLGLVTIWLIDTNVFRYTLFRNGM